MQHTVTGDATWMHHYDPDTKQPSIQWKQVSLSPNIYVFSV